MYICNIYYIKYFNAGSTIINIILEVIFLYLFITVLFNIAKMILKLYDKSRMI